MNDVGLHTELVEIKSGSDFKKHLAMDHVGKRAEKPIYEIDLRGL